MQMDTAAHAVDNITCPPERSILPWFSPAFDDYSFRAFLKSEGKNIRYEKNDVVTSEYESTQKLIFLHSGLLVCLTAYHELNKPFLISNICIPSTICGYSRYTIRQQPRQRTIAVCSSEVISVSFRQLDRFFANHMEVYNSFMLYSGCCMRSEMISVLAMLTLPAEDKLWILLGAIVLHFNIDVEKPWFTIPFKINREILSGLLYVSAVTIDRLMTNMSRKHLIFKENGVYYFYSDEVRKGIELIRGQ